MIPSLSHTNTILKEMPTYGSCPLLIMTDNYNQYVIKHGKGHNPPTEILNEFICTFLLKQWEIYTPEFGLIHTDSDLITSYNSAKHKVRFYKVPSFGSKHVIDAIELSAFGLALDSKHDFNKLSDPLIFCHTALFDTWVENLDRHGGNYNLLMNQTQGKFNFIPIDHAFVFNQLEYKELIPAQYSPSSNMHLLDSDVGIFIRLYMTIDSDFIASEEEYFYFCVEKCKQSINLILNWLTREYNLHVNLFTPLTDYLFDIKRCGQVFEEYKYRLKE